MRSYNANFITEKNKRADGPAPRNLLKFAFTTPVYIADYTVTPSGGSQHEGLLKSWGFIDSAVSQTPGRGILGQFEVPDLQLTIINSAGFSDNFSEAPEGVVVTLYQWFEGLTYSEAEPIFVGMVRGQPEYDLLECHMTIKGIWQKYDRLIGSDLIISAVDWPSADPDDIGKSSNIGYGSLTNVVCRALKAGVMDTLRDDLTAAATSFFVSLSGKTNFPSGTVVVQIALEQIQGTYNQSTGQFTTCTRGYNSTTAAAHDKGATIAEVLTEYVYEIAGHPVKTIGDVRVADIKQTSGYTAYTGQSGDELAGYEGRAVIKFTTLPIVQKQLNLTIDEGSHDHAQGGEVLSALHFDTATVLAGTPYMPSLLINGVVNTYTNESVFDTDGDKAEFSFIYNILQPKAGMPTKYRICLSCENMGGAQDNWDLIFGEISLNLDQTDASQTVRSPWQSTTLSWIELTALTATLECNRTTSGGHFGEIWVEVHSVPSSDPSAEESIVEIPFAFATTVSGTPYLPAFLVNGDKAGSASGFDTAGDKVNISTGFPNVPAGVPTAYRICTAAGPLDNYTSQNRWDLKWGNISKTITRDDTDSIVRSAWETITTEDWGDIVSWVATLECLRTCLEGAFYEVWGEVKYTPVSVVAGPASGVALSGNSSADTVIGGQVTVDLDGWQDDASGTITGTPNALIDRPDHVFEHVLTYYCSVPSADIDGSFATSGTFYNTNSYAFSILIDRPVRASELLARLAVQCRSRFLVSPIGKAKLIIRQTGQSSGHSIAMNEIRKGSMKMRRSAADDIINAFTIKYNRDLAESGPDAYAGATNFDDATSISTYGRREPSDPGVFEFDAVVDASMVASVGAFWKAWLKDVRKMPMFHVFLDNCEIESGDIIDVTHDLDSLSGFVCEVGKIVHVLGSAKQKKLDRLEIQAVEV